MNLEEAINKIESLLAKDDGILTIKPTMAIYFGEDVA